MNTYSNLISICYLVFASYSIPNNIFIYPSWLLIYFFSLSPNSLILLCNSPTVYLSPSNYLYISTISLLSATNPLSFTLLSSILTSYSSLTFLILFSIYSTFLANSYSNKLFVLFWLFIWFLILSMPFINYSILFLPIYSPLSIYFLSSFNLFLFLSNNTPDSFIILPTYFSISFSFTLFISISSPIFSNY